MFRRKVKIFIGGAWQGVARWWTRVAFAPEAHFSCLGRGCRCYGGTIYAGKEHSQPNLICENKQSSLAQDLSMMRTQLVKRLNEHVGSFVISEVRIY